jgi:hypothetical protein
MAVPDIAIDKYIARVALDAALRGNKVRANEKRQDNQQGHHKTFEHVTTSSSKIRGTHYRERLYHKRPVPAKRGAQRSEIDTSTNEINVILTPV